jgi:hypothetical protein
MPTIIGSGYNTYEVELGPATSLWQIYRIGTTSDTYMGSKKTRAAAIFEAEKLAGLR